MEFKISFIFPVIVIVLALISVFYLTEIDPFNYVIATVVFVLAMAMAWRIYYDLSSEASGIKEETEYKPSSKVTELIKETPKESKVKLDDFVKSSPKDMQSKDFQEEFDFSKETEVKEKDPFEAEESVAEDKYKQMKQKALKELKDVIKTKKGKKKEL